MLVVNEIHEGRLPFVTTEDNVTKVKKKLFLLDRHIPVKHLSSETGTRVESNELILHEYLDMKIGFWAVSTFPFDQ